jgi:hypothetical protein
MHCTREAASRSMEQGNQWIQCGKYRCCLFSRVSLPQLVYSHLVSGVWAGISAGLRAAECRAWQTVFGAWGGRNLKNCTGTRSTPCECVSWEPYVPAASSQARAVPLL